MISTLGYCMHLGHDLGFETADIVLVLKSSIRSVISMDFCEHDAVNVLAVSEVAGVHVSTQNHTDFTNLVMHSKLMEAPLHLLFSRHYFNIGLNILRSNMNHFKNHRKYINTVIQKKAHAIVRNNTTLGFMLQ